MTDGERLAACRLAGIEDKWCDELRGDDLGQLVEHADRIRDRLGLVTSVGFATPEAALRSAQQSQRERLRRVMP